MKKKSNIKITLIVRDINRAKNMFESYAGHKEINYVRGSIEDLEMLDIKTNYIVHTAAPTKSSFFIQNPVETIKSIVYGTNNILEFASRQKVRHMVNISSMESYGTLQEEKVTEDMLGNVPLNSLRSSYPESKRLSELLCLSYSEQYDVNVTSLRLAQTFGAGITKNENRFFKYLSDCIIENKDVVLKSTGETIINFCYLSDALKAILITLTNGVSGEVYNVAGKSYGMTIRDITDWLIEYHNSNLKIVIDLNNTEMFAPINKMTLDSSKMVALGWEPEYDLKDAYLRLIESIREEKQFGAN